MFDDKDKLRKEKNLKNKAEVFIFVLFRQVPFLYFTQLFALYATQLNNCLLLQAYFIKGFINYHLNCLYF